MPDPKKPIRRVQENRMIAGVCAGFAEWLEWDVTVVRVLTILLTVFTGVFPGAFAYIVFMIVLPSETTVASTDGAQEATRSTSAIESQSSP